MAKEKLEYRKVSDLIPYVNNPRNNEMAVDAVASSIKNFGFKNPIVIDGKNEIINGHTRLKAAKKLGMEEVPVIVANDLTPEQIKSFRLADNKVAELAEWDEEALRIELEELQKLGIDMEGTGFSEYEINSLLNDEFELSGSLEDYEEPESRKKVCTCPECGYSADEKEFL